jgi:hypothetical protein
VPRNAASRADRQLTALLAACGLSGSTARYERWRHAGLLPPHERHGAGRGRGSTSALDPDIVDIAAVLARHAGQGRDLRISVIAWFLEAGRASAPEPPGPAVTAALTWAVRSASPYQLVQRVRTAVTAAGKDMPGADAPDEAGLAPGPPAGLDIGAVRAALTARGDLLAARLRFWDLDLPAFTDAFADLLADVGLFPFLTSPQWRAAITDAQAHGIGDGPLAALARHDPVAALADARIGQLRRARDRAIHLIFYRETIDLILRRVTPGMRTARRSYLDELGVSASLTYLARLMTLPRDPAVAIAACLDPAYSSLETVLRRVARSGTPPEPGREDYPPAFSAVWPSDPQRQQTAAREIGRDRLEVLAAATYRKRLKDSSLRRRAQA